MGVFKASEDDSGKDQLWYFFRGCSVQWVGATLAFLCRLAGGHSASRTLCPRLERWVRVEIWLRLAAHRLSRSLPLYLDSLDEAAEVAAAFEEKRVVVRTLVLTYG